MNKINITLHKIVKQFRDILEKDSNFTGSVTTNFCMGGITNMEKRENVKVK